MYAKNAAAVTDTRLYMGVTSVSNASIRPRDGGNGAAQNPIYHCDPLFQNAGDCKYQADFRQKIRLVRLWGRKCGP